MKKIFSCLLVSAFLVSASIPFVIAEEKVVSIKSTIPVWSNETADKGNVGKYTSLGIDSKGQLHVSYMYGSTGSGRLKYAMRYTNGTWNISYIEKTGDVGWFTSLAIDKNDIPHISYVDNQNTDVKYAVWNSTLGKWKTEYVEQTDKNLAWYTSIDVDSTCTPHITYVNRDTQYLMYATKVGGKWVIRKIDHAGRYPEHSIKIDSNDRPHIAYQDDDYPEKDLKYAYNTTGTWIIEKVDTPGTVGDYCALALDINNKPHISYWDQTNYKLKYAENTTGVWRNESIAPTKGTYQDTSIVVSKDGWPHIAYYNDTPKAQELTFAVKIWGNWTIDIVDTNGTVGRYCSIDLESNGDIHISYYGVGVLMHAWASAVPEFSVVIIPTIFVIAMFILVMRRRKR